MKGNNTSVVLCIGFLVSGMSQMKIQDFGFLKPDFNQYFTLPRLIHMDYMEWHMDHME